MFTKDTINTICVDRLDEWRKVLVEHDATPFALISIGHNKGLGEIHMCVLKDIDIGQVVNIMKNVVNELEQL